MCNCQTVTISISGHANALSFLSGDYQESTMTNGHPSWVNSNYGIWYYDGYKDWVVGSIAKIGTGTRWIDSVGQGGFVCPFEISYTNWKLWYGGQWNSGEGVSFTCSEV